MNRKRTRHLAAVPAAPANTASINIRLSKKAREENLSLEGMLNDARALCLRHGLRIVAEHVDEQSGAIRNRKGFLAWLADGREGRAAVLVAYHVDRMTREGVNVAAMMLDVVEGKDPQTGQVVRHPVRLLDCKGLDSEGDSAAFRFRLVIEAEVARAERERMADRSRDMHRRFKAEGKQVGGDLPFGFQLKDSKTRKLVPAPAEARYLREAAEKLWAGVTVGAVVRWMNGPDGCTPRRAKAWSRTTLIQCLTRTPEATEVDIFTADERASLRKVLAPANPGSNKPKVTGRAGTHIGSGGLLACKGCGSVMHIHPRVRTGTGQKVDDYRCSAQPGACPKGSAVYSVFMDDHLEARYLYAYGDREHFERRATVSGYAAVEDAELAVAEALRELEKAATPEAFAALQAAQVARQEAADAPQEVAVRLIPTGRTVREVWESAAMVDKQAMLRDAFGKIIVGPGKKGQRSLDLNRLEVLGTLAGEHILGVDDPADYRPGQLVLVPEAEDEEAAADRLLA